MAPSKPTMSAVVPAYNEAPSLAGVVQSVHEAYGDKFSQYEIVIVNDGSTDDTGKVAEKLAEQDSHVRVIHNPRNMGYGYTFLHGVDAARYEYIQLIPGDGEIPTSSIEKIANYAGTADMVIPYVLNFHIRPLARRIISWGYTALLNVLFGLRLHYYNGPTVNKRDLIKSVNVTTTGFDFQARILIRLIKQKYSFVQVGIMLEHRQHGKSNLSLRKILNVVKIIPQIFWEINFAERSSKGKRKT
ncbi:glycosyltransferase family 2 protein [Chloroflexota bacterium]